MSHYQLYFTLMTQFAIQDRLYKTVLRPLADYLIMFINGEGLKKFREVEEELGNVSDDIFSDQSTPSFVPTSLDDSLRRSYISGVKQDISGDIPLEDGKKINIKDIYLKLEQCDKQVDLPKGSTQGVL